MPVTVSTMRLSLLAVPIVVVVGAAMLASSAFNYADLDPRTVLATVVADEDAYLSIAASDADYDCFVGSTNGKIDVTWDSEDSCAGTEGDGMNTEAVYYYHDVLVITNKGTKTITNVWLNMSTATPITININTDPSTMQTADTYADKKTISSLAVGDSWYVGFRIDTTGVAAGSNIDKTLSIEARTTA